MMSPVSDDEVKLAIFYIATDKAPGPDGYTSGFYQAVWPILGAEVTQAVRDFFTTGRLLRQVNATVLTLIPKPESVRVLKQGLDLFGDLSGLRDLLIDQLHFQERLLPMKYLEFPLISSRLTISNCRPLLLKLVQRIKEWEGTTLSYAGRV
ncbi:UNVERIFIED_CONTAM: hypothetical protein Sindi_2424200 [Sesamum indicum]